ncbi:PGF-CTERM sorting domain-containing protein [Halogeometricum borinquense]|uniref:PGF-CTERM sorting domain-containing protein n=1 Tax=Halogeometricum borinquense TaxID=60847 RepID=A0A6C0UKV9_9EURY|nr:PGF-CTERM sorting domain-containing protein [Halogeometricum borinquense]QIB74479.1 PGF-CTERM sorting domain-containing protein [Halogeometricum borinquense]
MRSDATMPDVGTVRTATRWLAAGLALSVVVTGLAAPALAAGDPTVVAGGTSVEDGEETTVDLTLTEAPDGVAGFALTVEVTNGDAATVVDAEVADEFGLGEVEGIADGTAVQLKAADLNKTVEPGASNVTLGSVTFRGQQAGETSLRVTIDRLDDNNGSSVNPKTDPGTLDVIDAAGDADDNDNAGAVKATASETSPGENTMTETGVEPTRTDDASEETAVDAPTTNKVNEAADAGTASTEVPGFTVGTALVALVTALVMLSRWED